MSTILLNRNHELNLPESFVDVDRDEMEYVDGGSYALPISTAYLNKNNCLDKGDILVRSYQVRNLSSYGIAKEIYAHALCYYGSPALLVGLGAVVGVGVVSFLRSHASVVNIDDGPDDLAWAYNAIWNWSV